MCNYTKFNTPGFFRTTSSNSVDSYPDNLIEIISMGKTNKKHKVVFNDENFNVNYFTEDGVSIEEKTFLDDNGHFRYPVGLSINAKISCKNHEEGRWFLKATPWCKMDRENNRKKAKNMQCTWKITDVWNSKMEASAPWSRSARIRSRMDQAVRTLMKGRNPWKCPV